MARETIAGLKAQIAEGGPYREFFWCRGGKAWTAEHDDGTRIEWHGQNRASGGVLVFGNSALRWFDDVLGEMRRKEAEFGFLSGFDRWLLTTLEMWHGSNASAERAAA